MSTYKIGQFAKLVRRTPATIRRWEAEGKIASKRLPSGHRYFDDSDLRAVMGVKAEHRNTVVYCRVSSKGQKQDLERQLESMQIWALSSGTIVDEWITEIGGGLNFKRPKFLAIVDRICRGEIRQLIVAHKDRLVRFGFELIRHICDEHDCELIVLNQIRLSPEKEMVEDMLAIVHTFSCRLYGMRKYEKKLKEEYPDINKTTVEMD